MRSSTFVPMLLIALTSCGPDAATLAQQRQVRDDLYRTWAQEEADRRTAYANRTPEQIARDRRDDERRNQETELLERALTNSPDYAAAVRRAAISNVDAEPDTAPAGRRNRADVAQARERRIAVEEARLSDEIEKRRRARLVENEQRNRRSQDQAALDACQARGQAIEASMFDRRSILNLEAAATGAQARDACIQNYLRSR